MDFINGEEEVFSFKFVERMLESNASGGQEREKEPRPAAMIVDGRVKLVIGRRGMSVHPARSLYA